MKIAICYSGHLRNYQEPFNVFKTYMKGIDYDIFIHSWKSLGFDGVRGDGHLKSAEVNEKNIQDFFSAKKILIEPQKDFEVKKYLFRLGPGTRNAVTVISMMYGIKQANELKSSYEKENNFTYDVVFRMRPDLLINKFQTQQELELACKGEGIFVPKFGNYHGLNDQFAFGKSSYMDLYANLYANMDRYFTLGCLWHPESLVKFNIKYYRLPILRTDIEYTLLRADGSKFSNARELRFGDVL